MFILIAEDQTSDNDPHAGDQYPPYEVTFPDDPYSHSSSNSQHVPFDPYSIEPLNFQSYEPASGDNSYYSSGDDYSAPVSKTNSHKRMPRIVVTPTPEDELLKREQHFESLKKIKQQADRNDSLALLSQKLSLLQLKTGASSINNGITADYTSNMSKDDKQFIGDDVKTIVKLSPLSFTRSSSSSNNNGSNSESADDYESEADDSCMSSKSLQAIRSVSNLLKAYSQNSMDRSSREEITTEEESGGETEEDEMSERYYEEEYDDEVVYRGGMSNGHYHEPPELLSVIMEEDEPSCRTRRERTISASTLSDCSTTIAADGNSKASRRNCSKYDTDRTQIGSDTEYMYTDDTDAEEIEEMEVIRQPPDIIPTTFVSKASNKVPDTIIKPPSVSAKLPEVTQVTLKAPARKMEVVVDSTEDEEDEEEEESEEEEEEEEIEEVIIVRRKPVLPIVPKSTVIVLTPKLAPGATPKPTVAATPSIRSPPRLPPKPMSANIAKDLPTVVQKPFVLKPCITRVASRKKMAKVEESEEEESEEEETEDESESEEEPIIVAKTPEPANSIQIPKLPTKVKVDEEEEIEEEESEEEETEEESESEEEPIIVVKKSEPAKQIQLPKLSTKVEVTNPIVKNEDFESLVTVRLPLRLSLSRTSNNEEPAAVGHSDSRRSIYNSSSQTFDGVNLSPEPDGQSLPTNTIQPSISDDISVSFSMPSRSSSMDQSSWHSKASSLDIPSSRPSFEYEDSDSEVSINVYLPIKKQDSKPKIEVKHKESLRYTKSSKRKEERQSESSEDSDADESTSKMKSEMSDERLNRSYIDEVVSAIQPATQPAPQPATQPAQQPTVTASSTNDKEVKVCVRSRIAVFETPAVYKKPEVIKKVEEPAPTSYRIPEIIDIPKTIVPTALAEILSRPKLSKVDSELEEDSGVTSDISRQETDTESENFPELRKLSRYQRAATHSRLFKLLQGDGDDDDDDENDDLKPKAEIQHMHEKAKVDTQPEANVKRTKVAYKPKKIIHNVSITRKNNPNAVKEAESMAQRRDRLSLNLNQSASIDTDNLSTSTSPTSPINDKLVKELVQSVLMKKRGQSLRDMPLVKLHAAAKRVLQEDLDSYENSFSSSLDSTPAITPQEFKNDYTNSYADYYETWNNDADGQQPAKLSYDIVPSKAFKHLQNTASGGQKRQLWSARCPRVYSSKTVNRDLSRVTEIRESQSPEPYVPFTNSV